MHRLPAQCKLAATVLFAFMVVAAPRETFWAYGTFAGLLLAVANLARVPLTSLARRLVVEAPFVAFALLLPVVGQGPDVRPLGVPLSVAGLWAAWNILAKATLGVAASALLVATTPVPELLSGLYRLRAPRLLVAIAGFMVRYLDIVGDELRRMRVARASRGGPERSVRHWRHLAAIAAVLFVRAYERGERVHLAMRARGFAGALPAPVGRPGGVGEWLAALCLPALAGLVTALAWAARP